MRNDSSSNKNKTVAQRVSMYLSTFKPAVGCTDASDFIVRSFIARLRLGITVMMYNNGNSKLLSFQSSSSRPDFRIIHLHPDGKSLSWKSRKRTNRIPKFDLSTCQEVRHAFSPDPSNSNFTGTSVLRKKCSAPNQHRSFSLISSSFKNSKKQKTVDITSTTIDQCKVLMEGFSALCFRLQIANKLEHKAIVPTTMKEQTKKKNKVSITVATTTNSSSSSIKSSLTDDDGENKSGSSYSDPELAC